MLGDRRVIFGMRAERFAVREKARHLNEVAAAEAFSIQLIEAVHLSKGDVTGTNDFLHGNRMLRVARRNLATNANDGPYFFAWRRILAHVKTEVA